MKISADILTKLKRFAIEEFDGIKIKYIFTKCTSGGDFPLETIQICTVCLFAKSWLRLSGYFFAVNDTCEIQHATAVSGNENEFSTGYGFWFSYSV